MNEILLQTCGSPPSSLTIVPSSLKAVQAAEHVLRVTIAPPRGVRVGNERFLRLLHRWVACGGTIAGRLPQIVAHEEVIELWIVTDCETRDGLHVLPPLLIDGPFQVLHHAWELLS